MNFKTIISLLLIISIGLLTYPVNAESGQINLSITTGNSYLGGGATNYGDSLATGFSAFNFDNTDYNTLSKIQLLNAGTITKSNSTRFTITQGGTGAGLVTYDPTSNIVTYYFDSPATITANYVVMTFVTDIFSTPYGFTPTLFNHYNNDYSINKPLQLTAGGSGGTPKGLSYIVQTSSSVTNNYLTSYSTFSGQTLFSITIDKTPAGSVNTQIGVGNGTNSSVFFKELTANHNSFTYNGIYNHGLYVNMSAFGTYVIYPINYTGCPECVYVPYYTPTSNGSGIVSYSSAFVKFDYPVIHNNSDMHITFGLKYVINDTYKTRYQNDLTWKVNVIDPNGTTITFYNILNQCTQASAWWTIVYNPLDWTCENVPAGNHFFVSPDIKGWINGTYTAQLVEYIVSTPSVLAIDSTNVLNESGFTGDGTGTNNGNGINIPKGTNGSWVSTQENIAVTCSYWDTWVRGIFGVQGVNDVSRILLALGSIVVMMFVGLIASKGNFGVAIILGFFPYAFFTYLTLSTPCGQYMPLWINIFIALIIGIKMRWFS